MTNPVQEDETERRAMGTVGRKALEALERHRELFGKGAESESLALAAMRASLYMGDPKAAVKIEEALPADSRAQTQPERRWMSGIAHFLLGQYEVAEPHLTAVADSVSSPETPRALARLGLLAVYQKLGRPVDQLLTAFRYEAALQGRFLEGPEQGEEWYVGWWPQVGWLMDLSYLLDVQLTDEELRAARAALDPGKPLSLKRWTSRGERKLTATYLIDYELAVRAARREDYQEAQRLYELLGVRDRAERLREVAKLASLAQEATSPEERLHRRHEYGVFLADHSERVLFNDLLWERLQRYGFLQTQQDREGAPVLLSSDEMRPLLENERRFKDAQEERWQAFRVLDDVAEQAGHSELGRRAARKAIECLDRISIERFGRETQIIASKRRLALWLHKK